MRNKMRLFAVILVSVLALTIVAAQETATCVPIEERSVFSCLFAGKGFSCLATYKCPAGTVGQDCAGCDGVCCVSGTPKIACTMEFAPTCCSVDGKSKTTSNACTCTSIGGTVIGTGKCQEETPGTKECSLKSDCANWCKNDMTCIEQVECSNGKCLYTPSSSCMSNEISVNINSHKFCVPSSLNDALLKIMKALGREI